MSAETNIETALERYPIEVTPADGRNLELRIASLDDRDAILGFARSLPETDLLFLRVDITRPEAVDNWLANVANGTTVSIIAYDGDTMAGYATVDRSPARWTRRVGELRLTVGLDYRGRGLGRNLSAKIFDIARSLGLKKLVANMTPDQRGAQAAFKRLGFVPEALLTDFVEDRNGGLHDLIMMSYDMDGLTVQSDDPLRL